MNHPAAEDDRRSTDEVSGAIWRGYRAKRSIKHGERSIRVVGQGKTRQEALANLERNITR